MHIAYYLLIGSLPFWNFQLLFKQQIFCKLSLPVEQDKSYTSSLCSQIELHKLNMFLEWIFNADLWNEQGKTSSCGFQNFPVKNTSSILAFTDLTYIYSKNYILWTDVKIRKM